MKLTMCRVVVILNTYTQFWGENSLHQLSFIVKWQGRRLKPKSGPDRLKTSTIFFRENRIQSLKKTRQALDT